MGHILYEKTRKILVKALGLDAKRPKNTVMKFVIFLGLIGLSMSVAARPVNWKDASFSIDVPTKWKEVKDLYGIPVTLLGPSVSSKPRAVIQIIPTPAPSVKMKEEDAKSFGEQYAEGKKRWVKEQHGEILELLPGKFEANMLSAGVSYKINNKRYLEKTHYISCPKKLFHVKIILNFENLDSLKESESIVRSFSCE